MATTTAERMGQDEATTPAELVRDSLTRDVEEIRPFGLSAGLTQAYANMSCYAAALPIMPPSPSPPPPRESGPQSAIPTTASSGQRQARALASELPSGTFPPAIRCLFRGDGGRLPSALARDGTNQPTVVAALKLCAKTLPWASSNSKNLPHGFLALWQRNRPRLRSGSVPDAEDAVLAEGVRSAARTLGCHRALQLRTWRVTWHTSVHRALHISTRHCCSTVADSAVRPPSPRHASSSPRCTTVVCRATASSTRREARLDGERWRYRRRRPWRAVNGSRLLAAPVDHFQGDASAGTACCSTVTRSVAS